MFLNCFPRAVCFLHRDRTSIQTAGGAASEKKKLRPIYYSTLGSNYNFVIIVWIVITSKLFTAITSIWHANTTRTESAVVSCTGFISEKRLLSAKECLLRQRQAGKQHSGVHGKSISGAELPSRACRLSCRARTRRRLQFRSPRGHAAWLHMFLV